MARIRVDPSELDEAAKTLRRQAEELRALAGQTLEAADGAPSYEGQFAPQVQSMAADAFAILEAYANQMEEAGTDLGEISAGFQAVEDESVEGFSWMGRLLSTYLGRLSKLSSTVISPLMSWRKASEASRARALAASLPPEATSTPTPVRVPTPEPTATPSAEEIQRKLDAIAARRAAREEEARRIRQEQEDEALLEGDPIGFVLQLSLEMYAEYGVDLDAVISEPADNPLAREQIHDLAGLLMVDNWDDPENSHFLSRLELDSTHQPNFEPLYFERLKARYPHVYEYASSEPESSRFEHADEMLEIFFSEELAVSIAEWRSVLGGSE